MSQVLSTLHSLLFPKSAQPISITTDSRDCPEGSMFFALKGGNFDGNAYAASALEKGCAYAVIDEAQYAAYEDNRYILVDDVLQTLQDLAAYHRQQLQIPVLQITGTNGKTTTKELVSAVLAKKYNTLFTQGNLNNHIGVPRTLLRITGEHQMAVIETGANHPGEIKFLCRMVGADCGLITNVGRAHLEGFGSFEGVKKTKGELYDDLAGRGGYIFLNTEDPDLVQMASERNLKTIPYVHGRVTECNPFVKIEWENPAVPNSRDPEIHEIQTHLIGSYNLPNMLAAITVGLHFGVTPQDIDAALSEYAPNNNRSEFRQTERNRLIIDAYNANATSMKAALSNFAMIPDQNKMLILGEMREMGIESVQEHQKVINQCAGIDIREAWFVGKEFQKADTSTLPFPHRQFDDVEGVKAAILEQQPTDRLIMIKGSNGTRLFQLPELL